ncbi:DUF2780 domain-containing protein [Methylobacter psychrophilus]|uniref:DUF2780 domain-containing protein n=1 Tax=Methylobacter psychrophilus TaxID=96941 RepID=UPI0021D51607|nr:DUF2780 domain-containing protein [Methylobacter psychrophilus]
MSASQADNMGLTPTDTVVEQRSAVGTARIADPVVNVAPVAGQMPDLVNTLVQQLGITPEQAAGGAGSIFSIAKQSMNSTDFAKISNAVPEMDQLLAATPTQTAPTSKMTGLMGLASNALGRSGGSLGNLASLTGSFKSLGLNSGMISQFIPVILQSVQSQGGSNTMSMLQSALTR